MQVLWFYNKSDFVTMFIFSDKRNGTLFFVEKENIPESLNG